MYIGPLPSFLYKYEPVSGYEFLGKSLKFSIGKAFNDIYDGEIYPGENSFSGIETLKKQFILCTSKNSLSNVMWGHYADKHKGFCVGFNPAALIKLTNCTWADSVKYSDIPLSEGLEEQHSGEIISLDGKILYQPISHIVKLQFQKESAWQYEEEFRLILSDVNIDSKEEKIIENDKILECIDKVIFGYRAEEEDIIRTVKKHKDTDILFFQARPCNKEYRMICSKFIYFRNGEISYESNPEIINSFNTLILQHRNDKHNRQTIIKALKNGKW